MNRKIRFVRFCILLLLLTTLSLARGATIRTLYSFPGGPANPYGGLALGNDGNFYGTTTGGGNYGNNGTVFRVATNGTVSILASFAKTNGANAYAELFQGSDGCFYGTTQNGGTNDIIYNGHGTVFKVTTNGVLTSLYSFVDGGYGGPLQGDLIQGDDGNFYGTRFDGGTNGYGSVFMLTTNWTLTTLASFSNTNGADPYGRLVQGSDGNFYGTTVGGGDSGYGTVFEVTTNGVLTTLVSFENTNGANPYGGLIQGSDGNFYGTTLAGGDSGYGTVFEVTTNGVLATLASFENTNGASPYAGLIQGGDGNFYGTTSAGGIYSYENVWGAWVNGYGSVFMVTTNGTLTTLASFTSTEGANPYGRLVQGGDGNFYGTTQNGGSDGVGTVFMMTTNGTLTILASLAANPHGANPYGTLVQGNDGNFYGTTANGGQSGDGTVFQLTTNGTLMTLASFAGPNGANPESAMVQGSDSNFYGTTVNGGSNSQGTVFLITTNGTLTTLASFAGTNGANPYAEPIQANDGNFYGTTANGGSGGYGTAYMLTTDGTLTTLVSFANTNGANPYGRLLQGSDGNFYGTTVNGGTNGGGGTVFMVTTNGTLTVLVSFFEAFASGTTISIYPNGGSPFDGLIQTSDGNLHGTTYNGTDGGYCSFGTVFNVTTNGALTTLYRFGSSNTWNCFSLDGEQPYGGLIQGIDGNFYGATYAGGPAYNPPVYSPYGTVFKVATNGVLTTVYAFADGNDGANPRGSVIQGSDGNLYGTTENAGYGFGTVFQIILPPTILLQPTNETIPEGGNVTLTVGASGFGPVTYQWRKNNANIGGATNASLSLSNVTFTSLGNYSVAVSNAGGTVNSSTATLFLGCPTFTISPGNLPPAMLGRPYSQTNTASGGVAPYTFRVVSGSLPPGFTYSTNGVLSGTSSRSGTYNFAVRTGDSDGCAGTNHFTLSVNNYLLLLNPYVDSNGWFHAQVNVPAGSNFVIVASSNLALPLSNWLALTTNNAPGGVFDFSDTNSTGFTNGWPQQFYRAVPPL